MVTVTIPKVEYALLQKRASLYETMLRVIPERRWGIERYTEERLREFSRADRLDTETRKKLRRSLRSR